MFNYAVLKVNKVSVVLRIGICFKFFKIKGIFVPDNTWCPHSTRDMWTIHAAAFASMSRGAQKYVSFHWTTF